MELSEIPDIELCQLIGEGSFGIIRLGRNIVTHSEVAVKLEPLSVQKSLLHKEYTVMTALRKAPGVPAVYSYGVVKGYAYMTMQLLGESLSQAMRVAGGKLPVDVVVKVAQQTLATLEFVHHAGYIHRDLKPQNFLHGLSSLRDTVFLIDFGLARRWLESCTNPRTTHDPTKVTGTMPYVSLNIHLGRPAAMSDDLESLAYMLIYLLKGELPWFKPDSCNSPTQTQFLKETTDFSLFCQGLPEEFEALLHYSRSLSPGQKPDYPTLRTAFNNVQIRLESQGGIAVFEGRRREVRSKSHKSPRREELPTSGESLTVVAASSVRKGSQRRKPKLEKEKTVEKLFEGFPSNRIPAFPLPSKAPPPPTPIQPNTGYVAQIPHKESEPKDPCKLM